MSQFTNEQKDLFSDILMQYLTLGQIMRVCWWDLANKKRIEKLYTNLSKGMSCQGAYLDAKNTL